MDLITINRIKTAHPKLRDELEKDYIQCNNLLPKGVRLRFAYVYRSVEEQNILFAKRPKVTNARGGQSIHNYGLAFDIVILKDKDNNGTFETASFEIDEHWKMVVSYFKSKGWTWGGDWKSFKDAPHFEKTFGHTWQTLSKKEIIINNGLKYPII
jgi:peptidoglycan L-alanyl-D-glutamate endopeptidase CwlK